MQLADACLERDGFTWVPELLDQASRTKLRRLTAPILEAAKRWESQGEPLWFLQDDLPELADLLQQPSLLARLQSTCGLGQAPVKLLAATLYRKRTGEPGTAWHQDARFIPSDQLAAFTVWLPLQAIDAANAPIQFLPGSHRHCLLEQPQQASSPPIGLPEASPCVATPMAFGDATIHTPWTLHGSCSNRTAAPRLALIVNYLSGPLTLNAESALNGSHHPEIVNVLRRTNQHTLGRRLQQPGASFSPAQWRHGQP